MKHDETFKGHPSITRIWLCFVVSNLVLALTVCSSFAENPRFSRPSPLEQKGAQRLIQRDSASLGDTALPSELTVPELSELARAWASQPKTTHLVNTVADGTQARLAVHEIGTGPKVIVCLHGMFGEGSTWSYVAGALADDYQLWLVDLPGCGESDFIEATKDDVALYSPTSLAERVLQALDARLAARPDVSRVLIAGHSLGGMITLRMFGDDNLRRDYSSTLAKVKGLVLFAPSDVVVVKATEEWLTFLSLNSTKVRIGSAIGLLQSTVNGSLQKSFCDPSLATCELARQGRDVLLSNSQRFANQLMLRSAITWEEFGEKLDWEAVDALEAGYQNITTPCLIVWGRRDKTLPCATGYKLKDQLPNARLVVVPQSMHLLPLERPSVCASLIQDFDQQLQDGSLPVARSVIVLPAGAPESGMPTSIPSLENNSPEHSLAVIDGAAADIPEQSR